MPKQIDAVQMAVTLYELAELDFNGAVEDGNLTALDRLDARLKLAGFLVAIGMFTMQQRVAQIEEERLKLEVMRANVRGALGGKH